MQGLGIAETSYQSALAYARDRLQGRSLTGPKNAAGPADPIIVHPDVRRMLMIQKSFTEAARALSLWVGMLNRRGAQPSPTPTSAPPPTTSSRC